MTSVCTFLSKLDLISYELAIPWMSKRKKFENYIRALSEARCPLENTFGWAGGSYIPVCKPVRGQRPWYCGHHKMHCLKVLVMTVVKGVMLCFGPFDGSTHDSLAADIVGLDDLITEHILFLDMGYRLQTSEPGNI